LSPPGPIPRGDFVRFLRAEGWAPASTFARHGEKWKRPGARRPVIVPNRKEIFPSVIRDSLETMERTEEDLLRFLRR
jgi:hypothetical protein